MITKRTLFNSFGDISDLYPFKFLECYNNHLKNKQTFEKLKNLVHSNNGFIRKIGIKTISNNNRSIVSTENIKKDEEIVKIPFHLLITKLNEKVSSYCLKNNISTDADYDCIIAYLLKEYNDANSEYQIYFQSLPTDFSNFPYFYKDYFKKQIQQTYFGKNLLNFEKDLTLTKTRIKNYGLYFTDDIFNIFYFSLCSRSFGLDTEKGTFDTLIPLGDMFNTCIGEKSCFWYFDNERNFTIQATRDIQTNEEIDITYGEVFNSEYLLYYGFTLDKNTKSRINDFEIGKNKIKVDLFRQPTINHFRKPSSYKESDKLSELEYFNVVKNDLENYETQIHSITIMNNPDLSRVIDEEKIVIIKNVEFVKKVLKALDTGENYKSVFNKSELNCYEELYFNKFNH